MDTCVIYRASFPNGKSYVGQSWDFAMRKKSHKSNAKTAQKKNDECVAFYRAINKYGWDSVKWGIILSCLTQQKADECEIEWILHYKENGAGSYNIAWGGSHGRIAEETKQKIRVKLQGRTIPPEVRAKIRATTTGRKRHKSIGAKISKSLTGRKRTRAECRAISDGRVGEKNPMFGKQHSDDTRRKQSEAARERWANMSPEARSAIGKKRRAKRKQ